MDKILKLLRFIFITSLWSLFYFGLVRKYFLSVESYGGFDILRKSNWLSIYDKWTNGWVIVHGFEHAFFFSIILFIPIWALCLWGLIEFEYVGFVKKKISDRKKRIAKQKAEEALYNPPKVPIYRSTSKKNKRPPPLRALSKDGFKVIKDSQKDKAEMTDNNKRPAHKTPVNEKANAAEDDGIWSEEDILSGEKLEDSPSDNLPEFDTPPLETKKTDIISGETVEEILSNAGYKLLKNISLGEEDIDFLAFDENKILLVKYFSDEGQWLADEIPFRDEEPQWFSEISQKTSPVKIISNLREQLTEKIGDSLEIVPVLVITKANIMNAEEIAKTWEDLKVVVSLFEDGGPKDILPEAGEAIEKASGTANDAKIAEIKTLLQ